MMPMAMPIALERGMPRLRTNASATCWTQGGRLPRPRAAADAVALDPVGVRPGACLQPGLRLVALRSEPARVRDGPILELAQHSYNATAWLALVVRCAENRAVCLAFVVSAAQAADSADSGQRFHNQASDPDKLARLARQPGDAPDDKVSQLLREARKLVGPKINGQIDQSCGQTVLLVDALAPKRNCDKLVRVTLTPLRVPMP